MIESSTTNWHTRLKGRAPCAQAGSIAIANLLAEMIEHEKKRRLFLNMDRIEEKEGNFVEHSL